MTGNIINIIYYYYAQCNKNKYISPYSFCVYGDFVFINQCEKLHKKNVIPIFCGIWTRNILNRWYWLRLTSRFFKVMLFRFRSCFIHIDLKQKFFIRSWKHERKFLGFVFIASGLYARIFLPRTRFVKLSLGIKIRLLDLWMNFFLRGGHSQQIHLPLRNMDRYKIYIICFHCCPLAIRVMCLNWDYYLVAVKI